MAGRLIDDDPQLALQHATAAKELASRLPIVREAVGESAYAAGAFAEALSEFRAVRRMTGADEYLPAMADCERALGRTQSALKLVREGLAASPDAALEIELRLVEAGIRSDRGQAEEAVRLLQAEIESIGTRGTKLARARLRYSYADLLEALSRPSDAERWFEAAAKLDPDETTDAADRLARLRGVVIEFDDDDEVFDGFEDDDAVDGSEADEVIDGFEDEEAVDGVENTEADDGSEDDAEAFDSAVDEEAVDGVENTEADDGSEDDAEAVDSAEDEEAVDGLENTEAVDSPDDDSKPEAVTED